jgi:hypothetical protein
MKKILLMAGIILFTAFISSVNSAQAQSIISCNSTGSEINTFYTNETVYAASSINISTTSTPVYIYIVSDNNTWANGTALTDVSGGDETATTNSSGYLEIKRIWSPTLTIGKYDIVVDVNGDGIYNSSIDYVDSLTATGFEVIPLPIPTLALALGPNSSSSHTWNLGNGSYNVMLQLKLTTGTVEDVKISSISLAASGTGNDKTGISFVTLVLDDGNGKYDQGETLLSYGQYARDDGVLVLDIENGYVVPSNQTAYMLIVYTMTNSSSNGNTYNFQVASVSAAGATTARQVTPTGLPITSATKTIVVAGATTTTTTTSSTSTSTTTTTQPTTTTTSFIQLPQFGSNWIYIVLVAGLVPVAIAVIILAVLFFRKRQKPGKKFEELREKWKKY